MGSPTYQARGLVLRKTKLGEADLIITLLGSDGRQVRCVAKGARKPSNSFAARMELFSEVDVLCAQGKTLDVLKEARVVCSHAVLRGDLEHDCCASPAAELLVRLTEHADETPRLYDLTKTLYSVMGEAPVSKLPALCAAHLLKAYAFVGLRPSLRECVVCGSSVDPGRNASMMPFSFVDGGVLCEQCRHQAESTLMPATTLLWLRYLLGSTLADIANSDIALTPSFAALDFCRTWGIVHDVSRLRSLDFLMTCGLFIESAV